jgi:hypothetical protein
MLEIVVEGLGFPEGPVALPDNNGGIGPLPSNTLFEAPDAIDGCLQRVDRDGSVDVLTPPLPGAAPHRPNDVCVDAQGGLCFTDSSNWEVLPDRGAYRTGSVLRLAPTGALELLARIGDFPNGIGAEPVTGDLVAAQTLTGTLFRLRRVGDGYGTAQPWAELGEGSAPDGFCWAPDGTLIIAGRASDRIHRVSPSGHVLEPLKPLRARQPNERVSQRRDALDHARNSWRPRAYARGPGYGVAMLASGAPSIVEICPASSPAGTVVRLARPAVPTTSALATRAMTRAAAA